MHAMEFDITIGSYRLAVVDSITVNRSVETLADTASISLPAYVTGKPAKVNDRIRPGDEVAICLGYDGNLRKEFSGYVDRIANDNGRLVIECIDHLRLFKVSLKSRELKNITLSALLGQVARDTLGAQAKVECDYDCRYDKFVISRATGYDVLRKIQEDFRANIYFADGTLHCHPPYAHIENPQAVVYDFAVNIEDSDLTYKLKSDRPLQVEVTMTKSDGKTVKKRFGTTGAEVKKLDVYGVNEADLQQRAEEEYNVFCFDGYEGNFTGWLVPYCEPANKIRLRDAEFPEREGDYYVVATEISFSSSGGKRKVILGRRLS